MSESGPFFLLKSFLGESTNGQPWRGWPTLGRPHCLHWCTLRGVEFGAMLAGTTVLVGVAGVDRDERRIGAIINDYEGRMKGK